MVREALDALPARPVGSLTDVQEADAQARQFVIEHLPEPQTPTSRYSPASPR
jgi:hypothetical protein